MSAIVFCVVLCITFWKLASSFREELQSCQTKQRCENERNEVHMDSMFPVVFKHLLTYILCICIAHLMIGNYYFSESFAFRMA